MAGACLVFDGNRTRRFRTASVRVNDAIGVRSIRSNVFPHECCRPAGRNIGDPDKFVALLEVAVGPGEDFFVGFEDLTLSKP